MVADDDTVVKVLGYARRIAVVGLSNRPARASYGVAAALQARGYEIVPVNPYHDQILGVTCYPALAEVPGDIDLVNVFRRREHLPGVAREAVQVGARGLWFQLGLRSPEGRALAEAAGLDVVEDRCLAVETARFSEVLTLPPNG